MQFKDLKKISVEKTTYKNTFYFYKTMHVSKQVRFLCKRNTYNIPEHHVKVVTNHKEHHKNCKVNENMHCENRALYTINVHRPIPN